MPIRILMARTFLPSSRVKHASNVPEINTHNSATLKKSSQLELLLYVVPHDFKFDHLYSALAYQPKVGCAICARAQKTPSRLTTSCADPK